MGPLVQLHIRSYLEPHLALRTGEWAIVGVGRFVASQGPRRDGQVAAALEATQQSGIVDALVPLKVDFVLERLVAAIALEFSKIKLDLV